MRKKQKKGCLPLIIAIVLLSTLAAGGFYLRQLYNDTQAKLDAQITALPKFDEEAVARQLAKKSNVSYPVKPPTMTKSEIEKTAANYADKLAEKMFTKKQFAKKTALLLKKIRPVKRGERVKFYLKSTREFISGTFQRIIDQRKGKYVVVNLNKYFYDDISPEYYYLFDPALTQRVAKQKIAKLKDKFEKAKKIFRDQKYKTRLRELYTKHKYVLRDGEWISNYDDLKNKLEIEKANFKLARRKKIKEIIENNQFLGLIPLTPTGQSKSPKKMTDKTAG